MGNMILAGVIIFLALLTIAGYKRGLVKTVFGIVSVVLVIVLVTLLTPTAKMLIRETPVYTYVKEKVSTFVEENVSIEDTIVGIGAKEQKKLIEKLPISESMQQQLIADNTEDGYKKLEVDNFMDYLVEAVTENIINAIAFIILFMVILIAVKIAIGLLGIVAKLPVLNALNKSGGAVLGLAEGVIIIWIGCIVLSAFSTAPWAEEIFKEINNNVFLNLIYSNNLLSQFISTYL